MKILVDENIPRMTVSYLRERGEDVLDIRGTTDQGLDDPDVWKIALRDERLLITTDRGFTEHRNAVHHGILIVRLRQPNKTRIHNAVKLALNRFRVREWPGLMVVVSDRTLSTSHSRGMR